MHDDSTKKRVIKRRDKVSSDIYDYATIGLVCCLGHVNKFRATTPTVEGSIVARELAETYQAICKCGASLGSKSFMILRDSNWHSRFMCLKCKDKEVNHFLICGYVVSVVAINGLDEILAVHCNEDNRFGAKQPDVSWIPD